MCQFLVGDYFGADTLRERPQPSGLAEGGDVLVAVKDMEAARGLAVDRYNTKILFHQLPTLGAVRVHGNRDNILTLDVQ
jgi:hypothetical protein